MRMSFGKEEIFANVVHVMDIYKNLICGPMLCKKVFKIVLMIGKLVVSKKGIYIGKGYLCDMLFKFNVMTVIPKINEITIIGYVIASFFFVMKS